MFLIANKGILSVYFNIASDYKLQWFVHHEIDVVIGLNLVMYELRKFWSSSVLYLQCNVGNKNQNKTKFGNEVLYPFVPFFVYQSKLPLKVKRLVLAFC